MKEQWMKDMQDRFADFEQPAPEGLLDDIYREMERRGLVRVDKASVPHRRLVPLWMRGAAAALVAVAIGTGTLLLMNDDDLPTPVAYEQSFEAPTLPTYAEEPKDEIAEAQATATKPEQLSRKRQGTSPQPIAPPIAKEVLTADMVVADAGTGIEQSDAEILPTIIEGDAQETKQEEQVVKPDTERRATTPVVSQSPSAASSKAYQPKRAKSGSKRWEVGASVAGIQGLGSRNNGFYLYGDRISKKGMEFLYATVTPNKTGTYPLDGDIDLNNGGIDSPPAGTTYYNRPSSAEGYNNSGVTKGFNNYSSNHIPNHNGSKNTGNKVNINNRMYSMTTDTHHRQPVKVGLSMRYHLNDRWSWQAGIDYSYHSSDLVLQIENYQEQSNQRLHFIGIPAALAYTVWNPGRLNVYLSVGGEIEKVVKGSRSTLSMAPNMADREERQDVEEKPWQLSIGGSAGVQLSITKLLSIYAEPGVAYYFDNKSDLPTIYQEKPFNFNINMGLRFNLRNYY